MNHWPAETRLALIECLGQARAESLWERIDPFIEQAFAQWRGDTFEQQHRADVELAGLIHRAYGEATDAGAEARAEGFIHRTLEGWRGEDEIYSALKRLAGTGTPIPRDKEKRPDVAAAMADLVKKEGDVEHNVHAWQYTERGQQVLADVRANNLDSLADEQRRVASMTLEEKRRYIDGETDIHGNELPRYEPPPRTDDDW